MSSKHLRRYLKEHEEPQKEEPTESSSSDHEEDGHEMKLDNKFAFLEDSVEDKSDETEEKPVNKGEKNGGKKVTKKKRRNKKAAGKKQESVSDEDFRVPVVETNRNAPQSTSEAFVFERDLFKIESRLLDGEAEMRKMLGLKTNESQRHHQRRRAGRIVKKKHSWPELRNLGLSMELDHAEENIVWFVFKHHPSYRAFQQAFWMYVDGTNHEGIGGILHDCPYHLDSLMIMAEVMRHQEDFQVARDLIERGIFCCESVFSSRFELNNFNHRISYGQFENRAFYLLLHRHMRNLVDRSCFSTALNVAKLIYRLDPIDDPLAITLTIDTLSLKAHEYRYLLLLYETLKESRRLDLLPSFAYSVALAHFLQYQESGDSEEHERANECLATAIYHFPTVLVQLLNKLNVQPDSVVDNNVIMNTLAHERESEGFKHLTKIFVALNHDLWKDSSVLSWLESATHSAIAVFDEHSEEMKKWTEIRKTYVGMPRNVERHAFLWEVTQSAEWTLVDPAPPYLSSSTYTPGAPRLPPPGSVFWRFATSMLPFENQAFHFNMAVERVAEVFRGLFATGSPAEQQQQQPAPEEPPQPE